MPDHPADAAAPEPGEVERLATLLRESQRTGAWASPFVATGEPDDWAERGARWLLAHGLTVARDAPSEAAELLKEAKRLLGDAMPRKEGGDLGWHLGYSQLDLDIARYLDAERANVDFPSAPECGATQEGMR